MAINWKNHENPYGWLNDDNGRPLFCWAFEQPKEWLECDDWYPHVTKNGIKCKVPSNLSMDEYNEWVGTPAHLKTIFRGNGTFKTEKDHLEWLSDGRP